VGELGRDVAAANHYDAFRQILKLHERIARDGMLRPGKLQHDWSRATGYQDVMGLQGASFDGKLIGSREPGHAVKGIDALAREVLLALMRAISSFQLMRRSPAMPCRCIRRARSTVSAPLTNIFLGSQPRKAQVPPNGR
jgi:hypothetical protein